MAAELILMLDEPLAADEEEMLMILMMKKIFVL